MITFELHGFKLRCVTCDKELLPLIATAPVELLVPIYSQCTAQIAEELREFHDTHKGHALEVIRRSVHWSHLDRSSRGISSGS